MFNNDNNENNDFNSNIPNAPLFSNEFNNTQASDDYPSYQTQDGLINNTYSKTIQNSNNQNALFSNEFKSTPNEYNNLYQNIPFQNNNVNPYNPQTPLFSGNTGNYNTLNQSTNSYQNNESMDVPPQLSEIKNLSEATISYAPTMDVLDPMNIMPEEKQTKDPLEAYDNGYLNSDTNINQNVNSNINPNINPTDNYAINNNIFNMQMNPTLDKNQVLSNINSNNTFYNTNNPVNLNSLTSNPVQNEQNSMPINEFLSSNMNFNNSNIDTHENLSNIPDNTLINNDFSLKTNEELNQNTNVDKNINGNIENTSLPYEIIQNEKLSDDNQNETPFLGLDDEYNNDALDIMDLNDDIKEDEPQANDGALENDNNSNDSLDRIKNLIDELNKEGKKVDIQEFNFDNLVQLIIKIYN